MCSYYILLLLLGLPHTLHAYLYVHLYCVHWRQKIQYFQYRNQNSSLEMRLVTWNARWLNTMITTSHNCGGQRDLQFKLQSELFCQLLKCTKLILLRCTIFLTICFRIQSLLMHQHYFTCFIKETSAAEGTIWCNGWFASLLLVWKHFVRGKEIASWKRRAVFLNSFLRNVTKGLLELCFCYLAYINRI